MSSRATRRIITAVLLTCLLLVTGCAGDSGEAKDPAAPTGSVTPAPVKIGTLATQDSLPLWVAEENGHYAAAVLDDVEIVTFQSAQELQAAFTAGSVNALMTDIMVSANLHASGTPVVLETVMLGATIPEGRFAVVSAPGAEYASIADLKGVPVGTASLTITEYVLDKLMEEAGVAASDVAKEEVDKMPVRFQLLMEGKLKAASLPEPFVSLAELQGAKIVPGGDDTKAQDNLSTTVLCVSREFAETDEGAASVAALLEAWDTAVAEINADPNAFRATLVSKARLPEPLAESYPVSTYPSAQAPTTEMLQSVLDWMSDKGYLQAVVTPAQLLP